MRNVQSNTARKEKKKKKFRVLFGWYINGTLVRPMKRAIYVKHFILLDRYLTNKSGPKDHSICNLTFVALFV